MATFDSTKTALSKLLERITEGKIQLPDFQRGWVWDDFHIRSLLVSIARSFPIGSIMLLETGGAARFQNRAIEGVTLTGRAASDPEQLILDGQQRLTSLTQVLKLPQAVRTRDVHKREVERFYYFDIEKALAVSSNLEDAIIAVDASKVLREDFGRKVVLDLSSLEKEFGAFCFPCSQILNSDAWEAGLHQFDASKFSRYMQFRSAVLATFRTYDIPVIELKKETSKEAVCLVFEKVNTGGVSLSVFELVTATYAADNFNLRKDWYGIPAEKFTGRRQALAVQPLLRDLEATEFLQGISLLDSYERRTQDLSANRPNKEVTTVSAKREHVLALSLDAYQRWSDKLQDGFFSADRFLRLEGFHHPKFLPYRSQLIPLAAAMVYLGERWLEPVIRGKLTRWFWCGVLGELYGGAVETRIALDFQNLLAWIDDQGAPEPVTVVAAGFQPSRLDTLRTRTSAAYRGIYILLQRQGSEDFFWKARMVDLDRDECGIDIHHIFPRAWCEGRGISPRVFNAIVNKTPISYKANRMIGGKAPSKYLQQIQGHPQVQLAEAELNEILQTHLIDPLALRADNFQAFYNNRKMALLRLIETVTGKDVLAPAEITTEDEDADGADD